MKIIHLSDPHIYTDKIHGIDPVSRFKKALDHILKNHSDADLFVITGDITDLGDKESYQLFIKIIQDANLPEQLDPKLIIGNHDNREEFKKKFPSIQEDENGFIQYYTDIKDKKFIFLDTNLSGTDKGHFCKQRQQWLINILEENPEKKIYLFMHHNPLPIGHIKSDEIGLQQKEEFKNIEERLVLADIEKGRKFTKKCIACHSFENDDKNKIGPNLFSIFNRKIASIESFTYSKILENMDNEWDALNLDGFLTDPKKWAPGTKMIFVGIKDSQNRANVIKYMQTLK